MTISRVALREYLSRDLDDFTWMKSLRRETILRELKQLRVAPKFKTEPWLHQLVCFYIGICRPEFLFLLDMGLGKSKIGADLITHRYRTRQIRKALVMVPNVLNMSSWRDDLGKHSDLEPWTCEGSIEEKWERVSNPKGEVTLIDYQGLQNAVCEKVKTKAMKRGRLELDLKRVRRIQDLYNFTLLDESHKLKNHQNLWFSMMSQVTAHMDYVYATTGTVFSKNPEEMWSQFKIVDGGETFGENLGLFRTAFFSSETDYHSSKWVFRKRTAPELHKMMRHRSLRYDEEEVPEIDLPKKVSIVAKLDMAPEQREHYMRALDGLIQVQGSGDTSAMEAPWTRMRQILSGYLIWKDANGEHKVVFRENPKLAWLEQAITEMGDSKIVVCHYYTDTGALVAEHLEKLGYAVDRLYGGTKDKQGVRQRFMNDSSSQILVMNTDTGGTGNDGLQEVARYMVMYESPTTPGVRKQVEKRLHRPGQKKRTFIYDPIFRRTIEQGILDGIAEGRDLYNEVVNGRHRLRRNFI